MFTGSIFFKFTGNGYIVDDFVETDIIFTEKIKSFPFLKHIKLFGNYNV